MYQDAAGNVIPGLSTVGYKAIGVPGSVKGLVYAEQHFGKLGLARVMAPAIRLARMGYALSFGDASLLSRVTRLTQFPDSRRVFQNDGKGWHEGDVFRQPELARTLERIEHDPDTFYTGTMARQLADFLQQGRRPHHGQGPGRLSGARSQAGYGDIPRAHHHQLAAALIGRHRPHRVVEHPGGLRPRRAPVSTRRPRSI